MSTWRRRIIRTTLAAGAAAALAVSLAGPATAAGARDGHCDSGEFCLYYNANWGGSVSDFNTSIPNYGSSQPTCYEFKGAGAGQGLCVKNNASSAKNLTSGTVRVYQLHDCGGAKLVIPSGASVNLGALANDNASHSLASSGTC